ATTWHRGGDGVPGKSTLPDRRLNFEHRYAPDNPLTSCYPTGLRASGHASGPPSRLPIAVSGLNVPDSIGARTPSPVRYPMTPDDQLENAEQPVVEESLVED